MKGYGTKQSREMSKIMANPTALPEELGGDALGSADPPQVNPNGGVTTETIQSIKLA